MTTLTLRAANPASTRADAVVIAVGRADQRLVAMAPGDSVAKAFGRSFHPVLSKLGFSGKLGELASLSGAGAVQAPLVVVVGVGDPQQVSAETLRSAAGAGIRAVHDAATAVLALPAGDDEELRAVCEGVLLGGYAFTAYKSAADQDPVGAVMVVTDIAREKAAKAALANAEQVCAAVNRARDWVNTPARDLTPQRFADEVTALDTPSRVKVSVWDENRLLDERCGGILGVGQGSVNPPRLVKVTYTPRRPVASLALVGKGITYDSGGLTLKTTAGLMTMKCDMAGAAAVVNATYAIAALGLPVQISCYAALAENMPSGSATRPGDVLRIRNGTTVEVHNTDAEGRLVLADALVLAREEQPDMIVDVATLTGACVVGLGTRTSGVLSNDDGLRDAIPATARLAGESMWPLPIAEEMKAKVRSSAVADIRQHNPEPYGGALFAAAFLREFVDEARWAHLDIAGPAFNDGEPYGYTPKGGTGAGVRTLVRFAQSLAEQADGASG